MFVILFWGIELLIDAFKKKKEKQNLTFFMLCGFFAIASGVAFFLQYFRLYNSIYIIVVFFALSQFPSFYIYIHSLTRDKPFSCKVYLHYLIPFLSFFTALIIHGFWFSHEENIRFVSEYLTGSPINEYKYKFAYVADRIYKDIFILMGLFYYWLINRRVKEHRSKISDYFSNTEEVNLNWIKVFNVLVLLALVSGIFFHAMKREFFVKNPYMIALPYGILSIFYFAVGHFGSRQVRIYKPSFFNNYGETESSQVSSALPDSFKTHLTNILEEDRPYLVPELSLPDLAKLCGTNRSYLSKFINVNYRQNFKQFINEYRLIEAEKLLINEIDHDIASISTICGFSSYHTFNRCFKNKFGVTPGAYRKSQHLVV